MKTSLNSKVLILSLSALVLAGSGCERRGRAPIKPANNTEETKNAKKPGDEPKPGATPAPSSAPTTSDKKPDISQNEALLETDARMTCDAKKIDVRDIKISPESFAADLTEIVKFRECMKKSGILLLDNKETKSWIVDSAPHVAGVPMKKQSAALQEFSNIAHEANSNDDIAYWVMGSRLELSIIRLGALKAKYNADNLKSAGITDTQEIDFPLGQKKVTIKAQLTGLELAIGALEAARADFKKLEIFTKDGTDLSVDQPKSESESESESETESN